MKTFKIDFIENPEKLSDDDLKLIKGGVDTCNCDSPTMILCYKCVLCGAKCDGYNPN